MSEKLLIGQSAPRSDTPPRHESQRCPLHVMDEAMLAVNRALCALGATGFETQALLWLRGRVDAAALRTALERLSRAHPIVAARLVPRGSLAAEWSFRPHAVCPLHEHHLPAVPAGDEESEVRSVLDHAARLLSRPHRLESEDPIQFHLLHRPGGRDVFLMQYNHTLMDNTTSPRLLREIDRLAGPDADAAQDPPSDDTGRDVLNAYRARRSLPTRLRAAARVADVRFRSLRGTTVMLEGDAQAARGKHRQSDPAATTAGSMPDADCPLSINRRCLDASATRALQTRVAQVTGFPGISMPLLGSAFRAIGALNASRNATAFAGRWARRRNYVAGIGLDLGLRAASGPLFGNLVSVVPVGVRAEELEDRDELTRRLTAHIRDRLQRQMDLGLVELAALFRGCPSVTNHWAKRVLRQGYSLWYAYFAGLDAVGEEFCGAAIDELSYVGPSWPPVGLTLLVSQFRGRLCFQTTTVSDRVPPDLADAFLDRLLDDLL